MRNIECWESELFDLAKIPKIEELRRNLVAYRLRMCRVWWKGTDHDDKLQILVWNRPYTAFSTLWSIHAFIIVKMNELSSAKMTPFSHQYGLFPFRLQIAIAKSTYKCRCKCDPARSKSSFIIQTDKRQAINKYWCLLITWHLNSIESYFSVNSVCLIYHFLITAFKFKKKTPKMFFVKVQMARANLTRISLWLP